MHPRSVAVRLVGMAGRVGRRFRADGARFVRASSSLVSMPKTPSICQKPATIGAMSSWGKCQANRVPPMASSLHTSSARPAGHQEFTLKIIEDRLMLAIQCYDGMDPEKVTMDSNFFTDLGLDSLSFVEVIMAIEDEFLFEIPDGDADQMKTPRDVYQYICDKFDIYE